MRDPSVLVSDLCASLFSLVPDLVGLGRFVPRPVRRWLAVYGAGGLLMRLVISRQRRLQRAVFRRTEI